ncbi:MAG: zeta toxin family protein [Bacteroidia bacterium]
MKPNLYIISGCNGAGKTTASFNILPEILSCKEYVNADEIARGISPFQPEKVAIESGRIMLKRIDELLENNETFAFETTLATKSFESLITKAKATGYFVNLIFYWLESVELAEMRVKTRVAEGGHNIPKDVIHRRYFRGIDNLFKIYHDICDLVVIYDNSKNLPELIYQRKEEDDIKIFNKRKFESIKSMML